jgi:hypothetical protein
MPTLKCNLCNHEYRDKYALNRHLSRITPCVIIDQSPVIPNNKPMSPVNTPEPEPEPNVSKLTCIYCFHTFSSTSNFNKHPPKCKLKDDPIRLLEIEHKINVKLPDNKHECRFCNSVYTREYTLTKHLESCKKRQEYHKELLQKQANVINQITNNNNNVKNITNNITNNNQVTNNNNIQNNNNFIILSFGNENLDNIKAEDILADINNLISENSDAKNYVIAGKLLTCFEERVKQNPQNKNTKLRSINSDYGIIKTDQGNKKVKIEKFLDSCIKNTAQNLNKKKSEIRTRDRETKGILKEVNTYAEYGFDKPGEPGSESDSEYSGETDTENILDYKYVLINES